MKAHDIMHQAVHVPGTLTVAAAARLMDQKRMDSVLVEHGALIGIFTERDILRKVVARGLDPAKTHVADIMSYPLHTIDTDCDVEDASDLMEKHDIRRLVVTDKGKITGILSSTCIARNIKYITARRLMAAHVGQSGEESTE